MRYYFDASADPKIFTELVRIFYSNGSGPIVGNFILTLFFGAYLIYRDYDIANLWISVSLILFIIRMSGYLYIKQRFNQLSDRIKAWSFTFGAWASAALWGILGWSMFDPNTPFDSMVIMIVLSSASCVVVPLSETII